MNALSIRLRHLVVATLLSFVATGGCVTVARAFAQTPTQPLAVRVYRVTSAAAFPGLPLPAHALIFRNGLFASPGLDYNATGATFAFKPGVLADGDGVEVVTLP